MARMAVRRLEARAAVAEVDLARDPRPNHPLQRPVDGRPADARVLAPSEVAEIVGTRVTFLLEEDTQNAIALG